MSEIKASMFLFNHSGSIKKYIEAGLALRREGWTNVAEHQIVVALVVNALADLLKLSDKDNYLVISQALTHDSDKRKQTEHKSREDIIAEEGSKTGLAAATSVNFEEEEKWGPLGDMLRFADSCVNNNAITPWKDRIEDLRRKKTDENKKGFKRYGMGMWDKLEEVTERVEGRIYTRVMERHPNLKKDYPQQGDLFKLVIDRINQ